MLRTHELHPSLVHLPIALLPAAALVDLAATLRPRDRRLDGAGRLLWRATTVLGAVTGFTGLAASQEIDLAPGPARDKLFLHGFGNATIVLAAAAVAVRRGRRRADWISTGAGLAAAGAAVYTAYLGGELVYRHGAGVKALGGRAAAAPPLFSAEAPGRIAADGIAGAAWLARRAYAAFTSRERIDRRALGAVGEQGEADRVEASASTLAPAPSDPASGAVPAPA